MQETKIKDFILSLDILAPDSNSLTTATTSSTTTTTSRLLSNNTTMIGSYRKNQQQQQQTTQRSARFSRAWINLDNLNGSLLTISDTKSNQFRNRLANLNSIARALMATQTASKQLAANFKQNKKPPDTTLMRLNHHKQALANNNNASGRSSSSQAKGGKNAECCGVKVSYWFQEDNWHNLFMQILLLMLVVSRWLITRTEMSLNQRSLTLIVSVAIAADIWDFFSYLNLNLVFRHSYLLYTHLFILSISLLQFIFLHVDHDNQHHTNHHLFFHHNNNNESCGDMMDMNDVDTFCIQEKNENGGGGGGGGGGSNLIYKHYQQLKKKLSADPNLTLNSSATTNLSFKNMKQQQMKNFQQLNAKNANVYSFDSTLNHNNQHHLNYEKRSPHHNHFLGNLYYLFCCKIDRDHEPLFLVLLVGLFLHDASYLTFRIFVMSKLGFAESLSQEPSLFFFMLKNVLVILTQIHRVYCVSSRRKRQKLVDGYKEFIMNSNINNADESQMNTNKRRPSPMPYQLLGNNNNNNSNAMKPPLPNQFYSIQQQQQQQLPAYFNNHHLFTQSTNNFLNPPHLFQSSTQNPYRFAQIYADVGSLTPNNNNKANNELNRSLSTLGGASSTTFFFDPNLKSTTLFQQQQQQQQQQANNNGSIYFHPSTSFSTSMTPTPYQQHQDADSLLAVIAKEFGNQQQQQQQQHAHNLTTPLNPFTANKVGKALYGLPFLSSRSKASSLGMISAYGSNHQNNNESSNEKQQQFSQKYNHHQQHQQSKHQNMNHHHRSTTNSSQNKMKSSKI